MKISNVLKHFYKICKHKYWVGYYCFKMGLYWRGIWHDMSKFSPIEFWSSAKYYQGNRSPIDAEKENKGYSLGWQHHKGRNMHHYEFWVDDLDHGGKPLNMPREYAIELIGDYLGAGKAYYGKDFTYKKEYEWWLNKKKNPLMMTENMKLFIDTVLFKLSESGDEVLHYVDRIYDICMQVKFEDKKYEY